MREIVIDSDTRVYYIYEEKRYYIENKDTTTYRFTSTEAKKVLDIVAPNNSVSIDDLDSLATTIEELTSLSYTWADDGSYIATIQLNDFSKHPLAVDLPKSKLYIMNTTLIFNLNTNEGAEQRLQYIQNYYYQTLGLYISMEDLLILYNTLTAYYSPTAYNVIEDNKYNNVVKLSNYNSSSPALYALTFNPYNKTQPPVIIGRILSLQDRVITLTQPVSQVNIGDTLTITNAVTYVDGYPYYANGTYTVTAIEDNTITVDTNFPTPFQYVPPTLNAVACKSFIEKVSREDSIITCAENAPLDSLLIGDTIHVRGTEIITPYETLTVDGTYTIQDIKEGKKEKKTTIVETTEEVTVTVTVTTDETTAVETTATVTIPTTTTHVSTVTALPTITVEEKPLTDYTYTEGEQPYLYKRIPLTDISTINNTDITLSQTLPITLTNSDPISIMYPDNTEELSTVESVSPSSTTVTATSTLTNYNSYDYYGQLIKPFPSTEVLIQVTDTKSEDIMPNTSFIVDNSSQVTEYLTLMTTLTTPTEKCYNNINKDIENTYNLYKGSTVWMTMQLLGLYSEVYKENTVQ